MDVEIRGDADGGPRLHLDHERFSYAGKFVMTNAGKAIATADDEIVGALSFNRDRTDETTAWIRYLSVRADRRGEGIGPRLASAAADHLLSTFDRVRIAVNNPFAYEALYKAGFGYTGEQTGIAELVLERPAQQESTSYGDGLAVFADRDLTEAERSFLEATERASPPAKVD